MAAPTEDPTVARRRLKAELRQARQRSGKTQRDVAEAMDWSTAKLIRIEGGQAKITQNDLKVLLGYYGIDDPVTVDGLLETARLARADEPWSGLQGIVSGASRSYLSYESSASMIRNYQPLVVPGLLQTEEYTFAQMRDVFEYPDDTVARVVDARQRRQQLHERPSPPAMTFILDEAVIRRPMGGPRVMRRQLVRLQQYSAERHITLQVLPFAVGGHPGLNARFVHLEFADPNFDDVVFLEEPDQILRDDPDETGFYLNRFLNLQNIASSIEQTVDFLDEAIRRMDELAAG